MVGENLEDAYVKLPSFARIQLLTRFFQFERHSYRAHFFVRAFLISVIVLYLFNRRVNNTGHFLAFLNINFLVKRLLRDDERSRIQPAFIFACLALAKLMKSSTMEGSSLGLQQAMILGGDAHAAFRDAVNLQWIDATLAEAALVIRVVYC